MVRERTITNTEDVDRKEQLIIQRNNIVYHGTGRADRVGSIFRKDRATSGPMAFFTDSRKMAEGYSKSKADTSLSRENLSDYRNQFVIVQKGRNGKETYITLQDYWYMLPASKRSQIAAIAPAITYEYDEANIL